MKKEVKRISSAAAVFMLGVVFAWGGMIYAFGLSDRIKPLGIIAGCIGYLLIAASVFLHDFKKQE